MSADWVQTAFWHWRQLLDRCFQPTQAQETAWHLLLKGNKTTSYTSYTKTNFVSKPVCDGQMFCLQKHHLFVWFDLSHCCAHTCINEIQEMALFLEYKWQSQLIYTGHLSNKKILTASHDKNIKQRILQERWSTNFSFGTKIITSVLFLIQMKTFMSHPGNDFFFFAPSWVRVSGSL